MKFISSAIGVEIEDLNGDVSLSNYSMFVENGNKSGTNSFYSIIFTDEEKNMGEIHFTKSFEYGSLNVIPFIRIENIFFILTSSTQHLKYFKYILDNMLERKISYRKLKLDPDKINESTVIMNFDVISKNNYELIGIFTLNMKRFILKFYSNGIISFPHNENIQQLISILNFYLEIIRGMDRD
ncbi:hypothetical protein ACFVP8_07620 [Viridibacillus arvi]|uniref:hypothetical protein n=1 Tax=Viridibacillus arvi TaxID=263475 RepID=UPI0036A97D80